MKHDATIESFLYKLESARAENDRVCALYDEGYDSDGNALPEGESYNEGAAGEAWDYSADLDRALDQLKATIFHITPEDGSGCSYVTTLDDLEESMEKWCDECRENGVDEEYLEEIEFTAEIIETEPNYNHDRRRFRDGEFHYPGETNCTDTPSR